MQHEQLVELSRKNLEVHNLDYTQPSLDAFKILAITQTRKFLFTTIPLLSLFLLLIDLPEGKVIVLNLCGSSIRQMGKKNWMFCMCTND